MLVTSVRKKCIIIIIVIINLSDLKEIIVIFFKRSVIFFAHSYAPWCPACKALEPIWETLAMSKKELDINVGKVDVTDSPGLSGRFMVTALPTIYQYVWRTD